jgi:activator of HSP90 ATPase
VFGQGLTLLSLLGIMGFKSYMDHNVGRFLSQDQADARVEEMRNVRERINAQLSAQQQHQADLQHELEMAKQQQQQQSPSSSNVTHNNSSAMATTAATTTAAATSSTTTPTTTTTEHLV